MDTQIGASVRRLEDRRLVTGRGHFIDDLRIAGQAYGVVIRSPLAHGRIVAIDTAAAAAAPGVLGVLTAADLAAEGIGPLPCLGLIAGRGGRMPIEPPRLPLADGTVRHVGDPVAFVVAQTAHQARDAAELVAVDYEDLPTVTDARAALAPGAPQIWPQAPGNLSVDWELGDADAVERGLAEAAFRVELEIHNNRLVANPMEPRGALGIYEVGTDGFTLHTPSQGVHLLRGALARSVLRVPEPKLRVVTADVGGGFGMKMYAYPEQALVLIAARRFGCPVKWTADRSESFLSDAQGRDLVSRGVLGLDSDGRILALKVETLANVGAYLSTLTPLIITAGGTRALTGSYHVPACHVAVKGVLTNTVPVDAYRGAGRPEAIFLLERLMDEAAGRTGLGPAEIRRRNFIAPGAMPYTTALGQVIDSGEFARNMDDAMALAEWDGFAARRRRSQGQGLLRGIGLATYVEPCGGNRDQFAEIRFAPGGGVTVFIGTQSNGQGHETAYAQIVAERLGIDVAKIAVVQGDTFQVAYGRGTSGSRSMPIGGAALFEATARIIDRARRIAGLMLEAGTDDIEFERGRLRVAGTDLAVDLEAVIGAAYTAGALPRGIEMGLDESVHLMAHDTTFPNGCHICEVEIDPETGGTTIVRYVAVDDFGRIINPMLVEGQVHGGLAQGIGQALLETCIYEPESGQLVTGSFMDYAMPRADDLPSFVLSTNEVPCRTNALGVKGCGEAGTIGSPPAVINAVLDALRPLGVEDIAMPATPGRIWQAIRAAGRTAREAAK